VGQRGPGHSDAAGLAVLLARSCATTSSTCHCRGLVGCRPELSEPILDFVRRHGTDS
jgi:hypothetical protein